MKTWPMIVLFLLFCIMTAISPKVADIIGYFVSFATLFYVVKETHQHDIQVAKEINGYVD